MTLSFPSNFFFHESMVVLLKVYLGYLIVYLLIAEAVPKSLAWLLFSCFLGHLLNIFQGGCKIYFFFSISQIRLRNIFRCWWQNTCISSPDSTSSRDFFSKYARYRCLFISFIFLNKSNQRELTLRDYSKKIKFLFTTIKNNKKTHRDWVKKSFE